MSQSATEVGITSAYLLYFEPPVIRLYHNGWVLRGYETKPIDIDSRGTLRVAAMPPSRTSIDLQIRDSEQD